MKTLAASEISHDPELLAYVRSRRIAREYNSYHAANALFETDTRFLDDFLRAPGRLLDLGCGTGRHVLHFAARGFDVTGVDLSSEMLAVAREKLRREGLRARLVRADICELRALAEGSFDCCICMFSTLGMVETKGLRLRAVREARRVLKESGVYALHVHNRLHSLLDPEGRKWFRRNEHDAACGRAELGDKTVHGYRGLGKLRLHVFSRREIGALVEEGGFETARLVRLNEPRTGEFTGSDADVRANGFLLACRKRVDRM